MSTDKVVIVENFLHKMVQQQFEKFIIHNDTMKWAYLHNATFNNDLNELQFCQHDPDIIVKKFGIFSHVLIANGNIVSDIIELVPDFKTMAENKFNIKIKKIIGSRIHFSIPTGEVSLQYEVPHYDVFFPEKVKKCKSIVYYINESDGDTVIFDEYVDVNNPFDFNKKTVMQRVSPKKGSAIMFDSNRYHCGSYPSKNMRLVLNLILELED